LIFLSLKRSDFAKVPGSKSLSSLIINIINIVMSSRSLFVIGWALNYNHLLYCSWKIEGDQSLGFNTGVREGVAPSRYEGSGVSPQENFRKFMLNPAFWWLLCLLVCSLGREISCFLKTTAKKLGDQYIVGPPT